MNDDEVFGTVEFSVRSGLTPWADPSEYVHTITGRIIADSETDEEAQAGEIVLRLVLTSEATNHGEDLYDVCDADSAVLEGIYAALFDQRGETKEELDIEPGWTNLIFLEKVAVDLAYRQTTLATQAIETALAIFGSDSLVVAIEDAFDLTIEEWRSLGFKRIAGTQFIYTDQLKVNPYQQPPAAE